MYMYACTRTQVIPAGITAFLGARSVPPGRLFFITLFLRETNSATAVPSALCREAVSFGGLSFPPSAW